MDKSLAKCQSDDYDVIFRPWITDPKTGKRIYPKNAKVFRIVIAKDRRKN